MITIKYQKKKLGWFRRLFSRAVFHACSLLYFIFPLLLCLALEAFKRWIYTAAVSYASTGLAQVSTVNSNLVLSTNLLIAFAGFGFKHLFSDSIGTGTFWDVFLGSLGLNNLQEGDVRQNS